MASIGNELKDGFKQTNNWITNNIQFLTDIEQFYRQRALLEKEYATNLQKLTAEYLKKKANKTTNVSVGDKPAITPGSLESASLTTWNEILSQTEVIASNHFNFSKELNLKVADQVINLQRNVEGLQQRILNFHDNQFLKQKNDIFEHVTKAKKHYDESCTALEAARSKLEKNKGSAKYEKKFNEKEVDMNILKNEYLLKISVANRIKDKFYYQDLPELLDLFQDLSEFKTQQLNRILTIAGKIELNNHTKDTKNLNSTLEVIKENVPILDSQMFLKHNAVGDWAEPADFYYIPSSIWHDDDTFITKPNELNELRRKLLQGKKVISQLDDVLESEREKLNELATSKTELKNTSNLEDFDFKKSLDVLNLYLNNLTRFVSDENKKVEAQVEIETIENNAGDSDLSLEGLSLKTKKTGFFNKLRGKSIGSQDRQELVSENAFDDSQSVRSSNNDNVSTTGTSTSHFKISSLLRSKSTASQATTNTVTVLQGTALFEYESQGSDEASMTANESFTIIEPDDGSGWTLISKSNGREGLVPTSYISVQQVQKKKGPEVKPRKNNVKKLSHCLAKFDYEAEDEGELNISSGEKIIVLKGDDGGWTYGENASGEKGLFPTTYVDFVD